MTSNTLAAVSCASEISAVLDCDSKVPRPPQLTCSPPTTDSGREAPQRTREDLLGAASGWNVVLISIDTLRADRLNAYGYDVRTTSPEMDALIGAGLRFDQATAPRGETWPSLATALTGLLPTGHGLVHNGDSFPEGLPTLPLILDEQGYQTGAFYSNMCNANHLGWDTSSCTSSQDQRLLVQVAHLALLCDGE